MLSIVFYLVLLTSLIGLATPSSCATVSANLAVTVYAAIQRSLFGMHVIDPVNNFPTTSIGSLAKGNCTGWIYTEPSKGVFDFTTIDKYLNAASSHGVSPQLFADDSVPRWALTVGNQASCVTNGCGFGADRCNAVPDAAANLQDLKDFWTALVAHTCPSGVPKMTYELWNEPYQPNAAAGYFITPSQLVAMTTAIKNIIRANCPAALIVTPSMAGSGSGPFLDGGATGTTVDYATQYFADGGPKDVDVASIHAYPDPSTCNGADQPEAINATDDRYLYPLSLQAVLNTNLSGKPVWDTEGSWTFATSGCWTTDDAQAAFIPRWYLLHWSSGISRMEWYEWDNSVWGTLCTGSTPCTPKPLATAAYQQTYNWMVGRSLSLGGCTSSGTVWSCPMTATGAGGSCAASSTVLAVWDTAGSSSFTPPSPAAYSKYCDLAGGVTSYPGSGSVAIGKKPILFAN